MAQKTVEVAIHVMSDAEEEESSDLYNSIGCPVCEKGIVTISFMDRVTFPAGVLASDRWGKPEFYHYTCDRCKYKILTTEPL